MSELHKCVCGNDKFEINELCNGNVVMFLCAKCGKSTDKYSGNYEKVEGE